MGTGGRSDGGGGGGGAAIAAIDGGTGEATVTKAQMGLLDQFAKDLTGVAKAITTTPPGQLRGTHSQTAVDAAVGKMEKTRNRLLSNEVRLPDKLDMFNSTAGKAISRGMDRSIDFGNEARGFGRSTYSRDFIASSLRSARSEVRSGMSTIRKSGGGK